MLIDGKAIASQIRAEIKKKLQDISGRKPGLAFILIGNQSASQTYVRMKTRACNEVGIVSKNLELPGDISEKKLIEEIHRLNADDTIDGILVQQPFPTHLRDESIIEAVDPQKDVDGFHPLNLGKALRGDESGFLSCTPLGIAILIEKSNIPIEGKHVVIVGRSNIVGKPLAAILMQKKSHCNATVTIAHSRTEHLTEICKTADILIAAIGVPHFIKREMVKKGVAVIDVGINRIDDPEKGSILVGDVDFENIFPICSFISPVPGGVGPMTIAMLLSNTLLSFQRRNV